MKSSNDLHGWSWTTVHREQLASIARATPPAMAGYAINVALATIAFRSHIPIRGLVIWTLCAFAICGYVGIRSLRRRKAPTGAMGAKGLQRPIHVALIFSLLLALPWSVLGTLWSGSLGDSEVILIALVVGMAASGSVLLAPVPVAACIYAATILVPLAFKCVYLKFDNHLILGALSLSFLAFLVGLVTSSARVFFERLDAAEELKESFTALVSAREETERAAMTDGLTGAANRRAFMACLNTLAAQRTPSSDYGVFYIDLDRFKGVNDAFGHSTGDTLLKMAAARISSTVRTGDLVARLGGDEFAVVAREIPDRQLASTLAQRLVSILSEPFFIEGQRIQIGACVGVSITSESETDGDLLLKQADLAMYAGKTAGRNHYCIFESDMLRSAEARQTVEFGLRSAIARNELEFCFQPIRRLVKNKITGFECLIRWRHPARGLLPPSQFLTIADEIGMANEIGSWVIDEACAQAAKWPPHIVVGINLSPLQIASDDVTQRVERALKASRIAANQLEIEITETSLLRNDPVTLQQLRNLKELGVSIALDDFGTGFSSLSYLVDFPFNRIKIDRLFINELGRSRKSDFIVRSISQLAKNLDCTVVAEGIETEEQLHRLRALHVGYGQGFLLGKPVSASDATELLALDERTALAQSA